MLGSIVTKKGHSYRWQVSSFQFMIPPPPLFCIFVKWFGWFVLCTNGVYILSSSKVSLCRIFKILLLCLLFFLLKILIFCLPHFCHLFAYNSVLWKCGFFMYLTKKMHVLIWLWVTSIIEFRVPVCLMRALIIFESLNQAMPKH